MHKYFVIFLSLCSTFSYAQLLDTTDAHDYKAVATTSVHESSIDFLSLDSSKIDTTLNQFYKYYPVYENNFPFLDLGLEASASLSLGNTNEKELKLNLGIRNLSAYDFDDKISIYQTDKPFTKISYSQGSNEMLNIALTHAQQISNRLTFGLDYRRIKNHNFYFADINNVSRVRMNSLFNTKFYTSYFTPTRKYEIIASYLLNKSQNVESGGIKSDSFFNALSGRSKEDNNFARFTHAFGTQTNNSFNISQYFRPGGLSTDSTRDISLGQFKSQFFLKTKLINKRIEFEDLSPDSANYGYTLPSFKDSIYHRVMSNEGGYLFTLKPITISASIIHEYSNIYMNGSISSINNIFVKGEGKLTFKGFRINGLAKFGLQGYNAADYHFKANAITELKRISISAGILSQLIEPSYTEKNFYSEALYWNNDFSKVSVNQLFGKAGVSFNNHKLSVDVVAETSHGLIYYSDQNKINQYDDFATLLISKLSYDYANTHFGSAIDVLYQNSSNQQVLPRPTTSLQGNVYGQFRLFSKKLIVQVGAKAFWFSSFKSPIYNPITRQWHNDDSKFKTYSPINVYANAKVKGFCFGVEFFHVQEGLMGLDYYSSPSYPVMPRSLRLNIRWFLND